jgi:tetraacyldisaccharide 4'-kinase
VKAPAFWWAPPGAAAALLSPFGRIYGAIAARRMKASGMQADIPVICVGNVTVGGSGKTPTVLALAAMLRGMGRSPAILTRGYGGRLAGPLRVDAAVHGTGDVGDEALLLARAAPTVLARDRPAGAGLCAALGADVILMDDGLQNPSLAKDFAIATFDGGAGIGNGRCLPAGPLRAPLMAQWPRIDAVLTIGEDRQRVAEAAPEHVVRWTARLVADPAAASLVSGKSVLAFAGIGRPAKFFETLANCGAQVVASRAFADHHPYTAGEIALLLDEAAAKGLQLVTTEKDLVRLEAHRVVEPRLQSVLAVPVRLQFDQPALVRRHLEQALQSPD